MDIYSAESYMKKLLEYVTEVNESKPNMYQKSKDRLKDLAITCNEVVRIISEILQDEALTQDDTEFNESSRSEIHNMIMSMESQLHTLKSFVNYDNSDNDIVQIPVKSKTSKISSQARRQAMSQYGTVLSNLADSIEDISHAKDCATLIWRWFDERFFQTPKHHPEFRYNIRRIPNWICDIVIGYSISVSQNKEVEFIDEFNEWCDTLNYTEAGDKYAVPYFIYKIKQTAETELVDCTPVVLWDVLLDCGLRSLCDLTPVELYLQEDMMYQRCGNINPSSLDEYINYQEDDSILIKCNLRTEGE